MLALPNPSSLLKPCVCHPNKRYFFEGFFSQPSFQDLLNSSFVALVKKKDDKNQSGLRRFELEFYPKLFQLSPASKRLFQADHMDIQSKAFVRMLSWIIENLENDFTATLSQLGGRHIIYGVSNEEYTLFSQALTETLLAILGDKIMTTETTQAWLAVLAQLAKLMRKEGELVQQGFKGPVLKKERSNGAWSNCYAVLKLNSLLVFKTKGYKDLSGEYPLKDILGIEFVEGVDHAFQLSSVSPPFCLRLMAENSQDFSLWLQEIDWRLQALHRIYSDESTGDISEDSSFQEEDFRVVPGPSSQTIRRVKKTAKKAKKKKSRSAPKEDTGKQLDEALKVGLPLTPTEKEILKSSWATIIDKQFVVNGMNKSGMGRLFEEFYASFFDKNPSGRRLFETSGLRVQGRALISMIGMVIKALDDFSAFSSVIIQLGGRHAIYGVLDEDFAIFASILAETLSRLLAEPTVPGGNPTITPEEQRSIRKVWDNTMSALGNFLIAAAHHIQNTPQVYVVNRKLGAKSSWKKSAIALNLTDIVIYTNDTASKMRSLLPLSEVSHIETDEENEKFVVTLNHNSGNITCFGFSLDTEAESFATEVKWRTAAVLRVYKYGENSEPVSSDHRDLKVKKKASGGSAFNLRKAKQTTSS